MVLFVHQQIYLRVIHCTCYLKIVLNFNKEFLFAGVLSCSINMCFRCTVESNRLTFICKVDDLLWPVEIYNNLGYAIAHCALPIPTPKCTHSEDNANVKVHVEQFPHKNETIMVLTGTIDQRFNGNWSCHHGVDSYKASVVINILKAKGMIFNC